MRSLLLVLLCTTLCCATFHSHQDNIEALMDNVLVLRVPYGQSTRTHVPLSCGESYTNQSVFWKKNGMELKPTLQGNQVTVVVEEMDGGNYTCHLSPDGQYLNHTLILIQLDPDNRTVILEKESHDDGHIHCSAPNYKGSFHCMWKRGPSRSNAAVLLVKAERNLETIPCQLDADGSGVYCQDVNCPTKEEQHRISLTVYIHSNSRLEAYTTVFYLREIVSPEKLRDLQMTDGKLFSWKYPSSWEKPCTYFGLRFQVKVVPRGHSCNSEQQLLSNTTEESKYEVSGKTKKYIFCVRAQDKHTSGPWNPWTHVCIVNKNQVEC